MLANDVDPDGGVLSITGPTAGARGAVACGAGVCNSTPAAGYVGADTFTYTISDPDGATAVGTVNGDTLTIRNPNGGPVTLTALSVCVPKGFTYVAKSVTGPFARGPVTGSCGAGRAKLTWVTRVTIKGKGTAVVRFTVRIGGAPTAAKITASAIATAKFAVAPLRPGAPIKVTAK